MKIKDKNVNKSVEVLNNECLGYKCYWPRPNPGSFQQGRGYRSYGDMRDKEWLCGTRNIHGCPVTKVLRESFEKEQGDVLL